MPFACVAAPPDPDEVVDELLDEALAPPDDDPEPEPVALELASPAGNLPNVVEIMFVDAGNDATESDSDQFAVVSAGLRITKAETVLDDPFASAIPRALPGSHVEYLITIENTSASTPADGVSLTDPVPANTTVRTAQYAGEDVATARRGERGDDEGSLR